jgi:hypothetical protein
MGGAIWPRVESGLLKSLVIMERWLVILTLKPWPCESENVSTRPRLLMVNLQSLEICKKTLEIL